MEKINRIKVSFCWGDNTKNDYYIIDDKSKAIEKEINPKSLAYQFGGAGTYKVSKFAELPFGNHDYVLEIRDKESSSIRGLTLASKDEVKRV